MQDAFFCCTRRMAGMSRHLGRDVRGFGGFLPGVSQQDTKEYLNQRGIQIIAFRESKKGDKEEVKRGSGVREATGPEGERGGKSEGKQGGRKGARKHARKTLILVPYDLDTL